MRLQQGCKLEVESVLREVRFDCLRASLSILTFAFRSASECYTSLASTKTSQTSELRHWVGVYTFNVFDLAAH